MVVLSLISRLFSVCKGFTVTLYFVVNCSWLVMLLVVINDMKAGFDGNNNSNNNITLWWYINFLIGHSTTWYKGSSCI